MNSDIAKLFNKQFVTNQNKREKLLNKELFIKNFIL